MNKYSVSCCRNGPWHIFESQLQKALIVATRTMRYRSSVIHELTSPRNSISEIDFTLKFRLLSPSMIAEASEEKYFLSIRSTQFTNYISHLGRCLSSSARLRFHVLASLFYYFPKQRIRRTQTWKRYYIG